MKKTKTPAKKDLTVRLTTIIANRYFFIAVAVLFGLQMVWIALSAIYPMLFDEEYHLGIIEIYSRQISPFITAQPPEAAFHGDITRYSSYFFHYLMSFPYRIITVFTHDLMTQVIAMRFVCIGLVLAGLWLFRKVLLNFGLSRATVHAAILIFTLIPLVPFSLAQINYDSLLFVFLGLLLYLTQKITATAKKQLWYIILFTITASFATITKFTALPVILGCAIFAGITLYHRYKGKLFGILAGQIRAIPRLRLIVASIFLVLSLGLVFERYAVNLATYKALEPGCDELHTTDECLQYTVFRRNTTWRQDYQTNPHAPMDPLEYSATYWVPHIFSDFTVTGAFVYADKSELSLRALPVKLEASAGNIILRYSSWGALIIGIAVILYAIIRRKLSHTPFFVLFGLIIIIYSVALWTKNYDDYLDLGTPVAAQGRYYIWLLIPVLAMVIVAFKPLFKKPKIYPYIVLVSLLLLSQGGGVANYILYSNKAWYWPRYEKTIDQTNTNARKILRSFTLF